jgi:hypothetical protein
MEKIRKQKKWRTYFVEEKNLIFWLSLTLAPFFVLCLLQPFFPSINRFVPYFSIQQCCQCSSTVYYNTLSSAMEMFLNMEYIYNIIFFYCLFRIRNITDEFNISNELKSMITIKVLTDLAYAGSMIYLYDSPFIILGFGEYI